jgi:hypothetical protein
MQTRETSTSELFPPPNFAIRAAISGKTDGIFDMPQSWDMGHIILLPFRRKAYLGIFWMPEKSNGLGRVPVASRLTTRPPKLSFVREAHLLNFLSLHVRDGKITLYTCGR